MYKYSRQIMWAEEDEAYIAKVVELPGCCAEGKTVVEAINILDNVIDEWIETAKEMRRDIPDPVYYEAKTMIDSK